MLDILIKKIIDYAENAPLHYIGSKNVVSHNAVRVTGWIENDCKQCGNYRVWHNTLDLKDKNFDINNLNISCAGCGTKLEPLIIWSGQTSSHLHVHHRVVVVPIYKLHTNWLKYYLKKLIESLSYYEIYRNY